jgi:hypothetical protein
MEKNGCNGMICCQTMIALNLYAFNSTFQRIIDGSGEGCEYFIPSGPWMVQVHVE